MTGQSQYLHDLAISNNANYIGLEFTINDDGTHKFSLVATNDKGTKFSVPIESNDAHTLTISQLINKTFSGDLKDMLAGDFGKKSDDF